MGKLTSAQILTRSFQKKGSFHCDIFCGLKRDLHDVAEVHDPIPENSEPVCVSMLHRLEPHE